MPLIAKYGGLTAKVMAMRGKLLKYDDYFMLAQYQSVRETARRLSEYPAYSKLLAGLDDENLHRDKIELTILLSLANDFSKINKYVGSRNARAYMDAFFLRNEIAVIRNLLCAIHDHRGISYSVPELNSLFGNKLKIDVPRLLKSNSVSEFIDNLNGTEFYGVLSKKYAEDMPSLFELEAELDLYYYVHLWKLQNKRLDNRNKKAAEYINGTDTDMRNIMWAYRLKKYYQLNGSSVYSCLIPYSYRLRKDSLTRMVEARTVAEIEAEIDTSPYAEAFSDKQNIERGYYYYMKKTYSRARSEYPDSLVAAESYLFLKEVEIRNLTSLIEGIRYQIKPADILAKIVI